MSKTLRAAGGLTIPFTSVSQSRTVHAVMDKEILRRLMAYQTRDPRRAVLDAVVGDEEAFH